MQAAEIITDLQTRGVRLLDPRAGANSRRGGAGPTDHKALTIDGLTVMVPVHTASAFESLSCEAPDENGTARIFKNGSFFCEVHFPQKAKFLDLSTADGIPYGPDCPASFQGCAGHHRHADLHPVPIPEKHL